MKKMIKLSLVAAVAVAGLTTTSSAAALSDSIKNTDLAGYLRLRVNTTHGQNNAASTPANDIKAVLNFKTKVSDSVTANMKFVSNADNSKASALNMNQANFTIATSPATAIIGRQTSATPFTANNGDTVSTGITALIPAGPATIAAAHYNDVTSNGTLDENSVTGAGVLFSVAGVNLEAWYAQADSSKTDFAAYLASTKVGPVSLSAHHSEKDTGVAGTEYENTQFVASAKAGVASVFAAYATTGKTSGDTTLDADTDGKLIFALETISTQTADADVMVVGVSAPVGPVTMGITFLDADIGTAGSGDETKISVSYAMAKNFKLSAWYSDATVNATGAAAVDTEKSRIEAKYSF